MFKLKKMEKMTPYFGENNWCFETCKYLFIVRIKLEYMKIKKNRRGKLTGGLLFPQDNARVYSEQLSVPTATNCGFELLPHPPYSPDVAP